MGRGNFSVAGASAYNPLQNVFRKEKNNIRNYWNWQVYRTIFYTYSARVFFEEKGEERGIGGDKVKEGNRVNRN